MACWLWTSTRTIFAVFLPTPGIFVKSSILSGTTPLNSRKINFANVLALLSEKLGVDYENVRVGMAADFRIGDSHLDVSHGGYKGFGGYCFPKDLDAFTGYLKNEGLEECADFLMKDREFNEKLLSSQGLTLEDVSVHDHEWVKRKLESLKVEKKTDDKVLGSSKNI